MKLKDLIKEDGYKSQYNSFEDLLHDSAMVSGWNLDYTKKALTKVKDIDFEDLKNEDHAWRVINQVARGDSKFARLAFNRLKLQDKFGKK